MSRKTRLQTQYSPLCKGHMISAKWQVLITYFMAPLIHIKIFSSNQLLLRSKVFFHQCKFHFSFGVCCLFIVTATSDTIDQNCTYIQNPSFPSVYSSQTALTYTINKCSNDVCSVRLDFETFATQGPALTDESVGGTCTDSFVASGTSGITSPVICGSNAGQHSKYLYTSSIIKAVTK